MIKILTDQNFNGNILHGLKLRIPQLDCVRTQDCELEEFSDDELLSWASVEGRVILTHDGRTFPNFAFLRIGQSERMCGVIVVSDKLVVGTAIDELEMIILCTDEIYWIDNVIRIPL